MLPLCLAAAVALLGQTSASDSLGATLGEPQTQQWRIGAALSAKEAAGKNFSASMPFPIDWPEQKVKLVREETPPDVKLAYKPLQGYAVTEF